MPEQEARDARIASREIVLRRESAEEFRVVEALEIVWAEANRSERVAAPQLRLLRLPTTVRAVRVVGGDLPAERVSYVAPEVVLSPPAPAPSFRSLITYRIPAGPKEIDFQAHLPVAALSLAVSRTGVRTRPGPGLASPPEAGPEGSRFVRYTAQDLAADSVVTVGIRDDRVDPRERLAVLVASCVAAMLVLLRVWRSGPGAT